MCADGEVKAIYRKRFLPNYGVFDEDRYFAPGATSSCQLGGAHIGVTICEDLWQPGPPATDLALAGAELVCLSASPFHIGKDREREEMLVARARDNVCFIALCNAVGGQDELIFDGHSVVLDDEGHVLAGMRQFEETLLLVDVDRCPRSAGDSVTFAAGRSPGRREVPPVETVVADASSHSPNGKVRRGQISPLLDDLEQMRQALELGLRLRPEERLRDDPRRRLRRDRLCRSRARREALGPERVHCVSMPSRFSSDETRGDAKLLAERLGTDFLEIPIGEIGPRRRRACRGFRGSGAERGRGERAGARARAA